MMEKTVTQAPFDEWAIDYDLHLARGLAVSGENRDYFAQGRIAWLTDCLLRLHEIPATVMDFGCGTGGSLPYLHDLPGTPFVVGVDTSPRSLEVAKRNHASEHTQFLLIDEFQPEGQIDLVFCNGIFHHLKPGDRDATVNYIYRSLRPGGLFAFWENNPWNPGAQYVMYRIPFDREASMMTPHESRRLLKAGGFQVLQIHFQFIFPRKLSCIRRLESVFAKLPFGAQYQVLCRKPGWERNG